MFVFAQYTALDYVIAVIVLVSAFFGIIRGITHETLALCTWIGSAPIAMRTTSYITPYLQNFIANQNILKYTSLLVMYILSVSILSLLSMMISRLIQRSYLSGLDSVLGCAFGVLRGIIIVFACYMGFATVFVKDQIPEAIQRAHLSQYIWPSLHESLSMLRDSSLCEQTQKYIGCQLPIDDMISHAKAFCDTAQTPSEAHPSQNASSESSHTNQDNSHNHPPTDDIVNRVVSDEISSIVAKTLKINNSTHESSDESDHAGRNTHTDEWEADSVGDTDASHNTLQDDAHSRRTNTANTNDTAHA